MYLPSVALICLEVVLFLGAPVLGAAIATVELSTGSTVVVAVAYAAAALVSMSSLRLYTARRSSFPGLVLRIGLALGLTAFMAAQLYDFVPKLAAASSILPLATIITFVPLLGIRILFDCIREHEARQRVVLVLGAGSRATEIARLRRRMDRPGFVVSGYVVTTGDLLAYCRQQRVEEIVVAMDDHRDGFPLAQVNKCRDAGIAITGCGAFLERETGGIRFDALERSTPARASACDRAIYPAESITQID